MTLSFQKKGPRKWPQEDARGRKFISAAGEIHCLENGEGVGHPAGRN